MAKAIALGYLAACYSLSLLVSVMFAFEREGFGNVAEGLIEAFVIPPLFLLMVLVPLSLPGFLLLRLGLYATGRRDLFSFAFSGAVLAYGMISLMAFDGWELYLKYPPDPRAAVLGAIAGAVSCLTERWYLARVLRRPPNAKPNSAAEG